jgi:hypothetical protein
VGQKDAGFEGPVGHREKGYRVAFLKILIGNG